MKEVIEHAMLVDRSGFVVLEHILRSPNNNIPQLQHVTLHEIIAVGGWYIWWERRELVKGESVSHPKMSAFAIKAITANYETANKNSVEKEIKWLRPNKGKLKLNIDAAYYPNGFGSVAGILRDSKGEVQGGFCRPIDNLISAAMAEAKALYDGLAFLERIGCRSCQVEADALEVIQACNRDVDINSPYSAILADCFQKASEMEEIAFPHCHREANQVAHELAKLAYSSRENKVWEGDPPAYIQPFVINDVNLFTTL
jgi:ribonuclease HI